MTPVEKLSIDFCKPLAKASTELSSTNCLPGLVSNTIVPKLGTTFVTDLRPVLETIRALPACLMPVILSLTEPLIPVDLILLTVNSLKSEIVISSSSKLVPKT